MIIDEVKLLWPIQCLVTTNSVSKYLSWEEPIRKIRDYHADCFAFDNHYWVNTKSGTPRMWQVESALSNLLYVKTRPTLIADTNELLSRYTQHCYYNTEHDQYYIITNPYIELAVVNCHVFYTMNIYNKRGSVTSEKKMLTTTPDSMKNVIKQYMQMEYKTNIFYNIAKPNKKFQTLIALQGF